MTPTENAALVIELEERARNSAERKESLVILRALRLAPDLETCDELMRTGRVPRRRLDPEWVKAYGLQ